MRRLMLLVALTGCGRSLQISPTSASADHAAAAPGNSAGFGASLSCPALHGCADVQPGGIGFVVSDTSVAALGQNCEGGFGSCTVTCRGAGTVTVTASFGDETSSATLTCR